MANKKLLGSATTELRLLTKKAKGEKKPKWQAKTGKKAKEVEVVEPVEAAVETGVPEPEVVQLQDLSIPPEMPKDEIATEPAPNLEPSETQPLHRIGDSLLWYLTERLPKGARYSYSFYVTKGELAASKLMPDPWAARTYADDSVVELPGAKPQPLVGTSHECAAGQAGVVLKKSDLLKMDRAVTVYTPVGYAPKVDSVGLLIVFDGESSGRDLKGFNPIPGANHPGQSDRQESN